MPETNKALQLRQEDVKYFLAAHTHIGATNVNYQMEQYVFKRRSDGVHLIDLSKTWEKIVLAARAIVAVECSAEVCAIACSSSSGDSKPLGQRAVLKFAKYTGATPIAGRYTPGTFTNQIQQVIVVVELLRSACSLEWASVVLRRNSNVLDYYSGQYDRVKQARFVYDSSATSALAI